MDHKTFVKSFFKRRLHTNAKAFLLLAAVHRVDVAQNLHGLVVLSPGDEELGALFGQSE